jgi:hypothetical protein
MADEQQVKKVYEGGLTQTEANYLPLAPGNKKACANCRWFEVNGWEGEPPECRIVQNWPEPIQNVGVCDRWEGTPVNEPIEMQPIPVVIVEPTVEVVTMEKKTIVGRIKEMFTGSKDAPEFEVFKDDSGVWHWHATYTNNYEDLEGEILAEKAHDKFINRLDMGLVPMPELWAWHTFGTAHGKAQMIWRNGHFIHAVGDFDSTPEAKAAIEYYRKNKVKLSHGFTVPKWAFKEGVYSDYNTFEISTLPPKAAANPYTSFEELKTMAMTDEKRRQLKEVFKWDDAKIAQVESMDENRAKALGELEVAYKDFADTTGESKVETKATEKDLSETMFGVMEGQNLTLEMVKNILAVAKEQKTETAKAVEAFKAQVSTLQTELADVRKQLNMKPQRASEAAATIVDELTAAAHKGKLPQDVDEKTKALQAQFGNAIKVGE